MTISVIIATFNRAALLAECLDHLARQHFERGDQVIVVDNGSTDRTKIVVAEAESLAENLIGLAYGEFRFPLPGQLK